MSRKRILVQVAVGALLVLILVIGGNALGQEEPPPPTAEVAPAGEGDQAADLPPTPAEGPAPAGSSGEPQPPAAPEAEVPVTFTYQGRLDDGGGPANGNYDFTFRIWDAASGGAVLVSTTRLAVPVSNGTFTTDIVGAASTFDGQERWLEIGVRQAGSGSYEFLSPRQPLTAVPYALGLRPGAIISGSVAGAALDVTNSSLYANGIVARSVTGDSFASYAAGSDGLYVQNPVDNGVEVYGPGGPGVRVASAAVDGIEVSGAGDDGVQITGVSGDGVFVSSPGAAGFFASNAGTYGVLASSGNASYFGGYFYNTQAGGRGLYTSAGDENSDDLVLGGSDGRIQASALRVESTSDQYFYANGNDYRFYRYTGSSYAEGIRLATNELGNDGAQITLFNDSGLATIEIDAEYNDGGDSRITTDILEIQGGADLSEQFDVRHTETGRPEPGLVVCIDAEHPGRLRVCEGSYNRTVVGVLSGAGGVKPGLLMRQRESAADGEMPVALTGRVYVYVDATGGEVLPGDLLTTGETSGYAMKVEDYAAAQGAILGKAMEGLAAGEQGLVLIVVTLQ